MRSKTFKTHGGHLNSDVYNKPSTVFAQDRYVISPAPDYLDVAGFFKCYFPVGFCGWERGHIRNGDTSLAFLLEEGSSSVEWILRQDRGEGVDMRV